MKKALLISLLIMAAVQLFAQKQTLEIFFVCQMLKQDPSVLKILMAKKERAAWQQLVPAQVLHVILVRNGK
jgi:hypothetical protein